jgi:hypothetical protein
MCGGSLERRSELTGVARCRGGAKTKVVDHLGNKDMRDAS